jgi:GNAT superfamily N-acetyltransferase
VCLAFDQPDRRVPEAAVDHGRPEASRVDSGREPGGRVKRRVEADERFGGDQPPTSEGRRIELAYHEDPTIAEHAIALGQNRLLFLHVVESVDDQDGVDRPVGDREAGPVSSDGVEPVAASLLDHPRSRIDHDPAGDADRPGGPAGAAADVQQPVDRPAGAVERALQRSRLRPWHGEVVETREAVEGADVADHTSLEAGPGQKPLMRRNRTRSMDLVVRAWPPDGDALDLDHEQFIYGGKFNTGRTAKALARDDGEVVGAVAFNEDRAAADALRIRYVSVREDRRAEGIGPRLLRFAATRARDHGYDRVRIAVNNPYAYQACYRAGFSFTGEETGIAELVMTFPAEDRSPERYREGIAIFADRDLPDDQAEFVTDTDTHPPTVIETPAE